MVVSGRFLVTVFLVVSVAFPLFGQTGETVLEEALGGIENSFYEALYKGSASEAEGILEKAAKDKVGSDSNVIGQLMVALANHFCENGDFDRSKKWFERVEKDFGALRMEEENSRTFSDVVKSKLAWLRAGGKRTWLASDPVRLAEQLFSALEKKDQGSLEVTLSHVDVYVGWWQSELEPTSREELLGFIEKSRGEKVTWDNRDDLKKRIQAGESVLFLNTHGWKDMDGHTNIQFALHKVNNGWEWRGIVLGESPEP